jgi:hypothetical protein
VTGVPEATVRVTLPEGVSAAPLTSDNVTYHGTIPFE